MSDADNKAPAQPDHLGMSDEDFLKAPVPVAVEAASDAGEPVTVIAEPTVVTPVLETDEADDTDEDDQVPAKVPGAAEGADKGTVADPTAKEVVPADPAKDATKPTDKAAAPVVPAVVVDYKAEYERLLKPFKANGRDVSVASVDDALSLMQMGANIVLCDPHRIVVTGPAHLYGAHMSSPDVRAGMALLMAAAIAEGTSEIDNIYQIERGYMNIEKKMRALGARIKREE